MPAEQLLDYAKISSYSWVMPRRKPGTLLPLEVEILATAWELSRAGQGDFHGFGIAKRMGERADTRTLTGHGTLYKALGRLEEFGLLTSRWEDPEVARGRPRRRMYALTGAGQRVALDAAQRSHAGPMRAAPEPS